MMGTLGRTSFKALLVAVPAAVGVLVVGIRVKYPPVLGLVRRTLRDRTNPSVLATAGTPGQETGVIVHEGRRSGRTFRTPVTPVPVDDGYVIALPYGPETDWVRNVLAAGGATLITQGEEFRIDRPEVQSLDQYVSSFPPAARRGMQVINVTECLRLHRA